MSLSSSLEKQRKQAQTLMQYQTLQWLNLMPIDILVFFIWFRENYSWKYSLRFFGQNFRNYGVFFARQLEGTHWFRINSIITRNPAFIRLDLNQLSTHKISVYKGRAFGQVQILQSFKSKQFDRSCSFASKFP